jgi:AmmeMemoRadiSam system protein B
MGAHTQLCLVVAALCVSTFADGAENLGPSRADVEEMMGLPSDGDLVRGQLDTLGFVVGQPAAEEVVAAAVRLEQDSLAEQDGRLAMAPGDGFVGGICPHDDHLYASRVYVHLTERITAPRVLLIGVFHKARLWDLRDRVVFDSFEAWHGPWEPIRVDPLREELIAALPEDTHVVDNAMHCREHSLEALLPFLQRGHPERTIVPILVPYMGWDRLTEITDRLASAVAEIMKANGWRLGRDLAIVISSDAVHYGPDFDHAPFGTDAEAYERAVARDTGLAHDHLEGDLDPIKLHGLLDTLVDPDDLSYRLPWCGRFSVPFGLELLRKIAVESGEDIPEGTLLSYGTSLSEPELPVSAETRENGLGYTAPSNLHHWVGYAALGYLLPN